MVRIFLVLWIVSLLAAFTFGCDNCVAQRKAQQQASEGRMRHVGGSFGTGHYEGVGFSTRSADDAIRRCCYWGQRTPVGIGVLVDPRAGMQRFFIVDRFQLLGWSFC